MDDTRTPLDLRAERILDLQAGGWQAAGHDVEYQMLGRGGGDYAVAGRCVNADCAMALDFAIHAGRYILSGRRDYGTCPATRQLHLAAARAASIKPSPIAGEGDQRRKR